LCVPIAALAGKDPHEKEEKKGEIEEEENSAVFLRGRDQIPRQFFFSRDFFIEFKST